MARLSKEELNKIKEQYGVDELFSWSKVNTFMTSPYEYYLKYIGNDMDIYNAIRNHVFGRIGMSKLEEIILISDYTEENRTYDDCIKVRKIVLEGKLNKAIYESTRFVVEYISQKGKTPHPVQLGVLKYYEGLSD